jgi:hypothetical protein
MGQYKNILVVGNGFDLALDLPTSYQHFMKSFLRYRAEQCGLPICTIKEKDLSEFHASFIVNMNKLRVSWDEIKYGKFNDVMLKNIFIVLMIFKYNPTELARSCIAPAPKNNLSGTTMYPSFEGEKHDLSEDYYKENDIAGNGFSWFNVEDILFQISDSKEFSKIASTIEDCAKRCYVLPKLYGCREIFGKHEEYQKPEYYRELIKGLKLFKKSLATYLFTVEQFYGNRVTEKFETIKNSLTEKTFDEIISLNYTSFAEKLFCIPERSYHHPHGKINKEDPNFSEIVLGYYGDIKKNKLDTHFIEFQKFYQRILYGLGNYVKKDDCVKNIEFFGFSCDPADTELLKALLLDDKDKTVAGLNKVIVHCHKDKNQNIINLVQCIGKENVLDLTNKGILKFKLDTH